jgi:hypothetical protein
MKIHGVNYDSRLSGGINLFLIAAVVLVNGIAVLGPRPSDVSASPAGTILYEPQNALPNALEPVSDAAQAVIATGPLFVNPDNPRYFTDGTIINGKHKSVLLTGSHTWCNFMDCGFTNPITTNFNYPAYLDFLQSHNHNFFRMWRAENARGGEAEPQNTFYFSPMPYARSSQPGAFDGGNKFDLTQFNQAYFDLMRSRVIAARDRGIYVSVMLFDGWSVESKFGSHQPWPGHPYHSSNNINGIDGDTNDDNQGGETHTLANPQITDLQKAYVAKVIDTVQDLDNVLFEISNESSGNSTAWQYEMINYVKTYHQTRGYPQHPVGMTWQYQNGNNANLTASPADWISLGTSGVDINSYVPPVADGNYVILSDTDHLCGICGNRQWVWRSFTRGENPIYMDFYNNNATGRGMPFSHPQAQEIRNNLGYVRSYAARMDLTVMLPRPDLCSTGYCLANPTAQGAAYLVYLPSGGTVNVNLSAASGQLQVEWFNTASGTVGGTGTVMGGATRSLTAPFSGDAVLYIYAQAGGTQTQTPTSTATRTPTLTPVSTGGPSTLILQPNGATGIDSFIYSSSKTTNFGGASSMGVGEDNGANNRIARSLIQFNLSAIPANATITSATLSLWTSGDLSDNNRLIRVYRLKVPFNETQVTWERAATGVSWQQIGASGINDRETTAIGSVTVLNNEALNTEKQIALTPSKIQELVNGTFVNNGFIIVADTELNDRFSYHTSDSSAAAQRPKLVIQYVVGPPTNTATVTPSSTATFTRTPTATHTPTFTHTLTAIPSQTGSPLPSATSTATLIASITPIATQSATPSATSSPGDLIFSDGFESGNLAAWTSGTVDGGDLSVSPAGALRGSQGLQALIDDNNPLVVIDERPSAETRYRVRFHFDPNSIPMALGNAHLILVGLGGNGNMLVLQLELRFQSAGYEVRALLANDAKGSSSTGWIPISDAPHALELDWRAATAVGANNGGLTFWIDGVQRADVTGVDNDTRRIDQVRLGAVSGIDNGTRGTYFLDAFESRRSTYIGP